MAKTLKVSRKSVRCVRRYLAFYMLVECPVYVGEGNHKNGVNTATLRLRYSFTIYEVFRSPSISTGAWFHRQQFACLCIPPTWRW